MPALPPIVWLALVLLILFLLTLIAATLYAVLRGPANTHIAALGARAVLALGLLGALPWGIAVLAPLEINVKIDGIGPLILWCALALGVFAGLVLVPLAAGTAVAIWLLARRRAPDNPQSG